MKEKDFIEIIKSVTGSGYIGDDCAYLKDLGIVMTQDNLVEDVHFRRNWITPYQLGRKAVMVSISDVCASGAKPLYATIGLSMPADTDEKFIKEFYEGACSAGVEIVGGDLTGADKIFISVTVIGSAAGRRISSRAHACVGQKVVVSGEHGASAAGLEMLNPHPNPLPKGEGARFIKAHLEPIAQCEFSERIATNIK
ncbi:MAG: thiamine-phosphate kinase, partial [Heliobacteriaceae bacterium]|nr:thiamine-phosphate kinase [Heliobacteriaceae bacterium]